ncbi:MULTISPECIES: DUF1128 domain-containing protein [Pontibacillus]|uniref:Uncharacterized protein n=1 Tax=Pontibacillus marinus BH030004 = DSM 16465 TaxID=1385511 RepID=A0A0A5HJ51_9BACI|nr:MULTISPECIES: DUF1128 domain-containing protein [Pontibacillus]KGX83677.1 hypothetical protein N783_01635 [Pontibacillus marinus BH030004 = DSM 16465]QHE52161.1 DUF1128 family protein [Pontibacillus sp. HMF3514]
MNLNEPTNENLRYMINHLADQLQVVNRGLMDPEDYDLKHYEDIKDIYDMTQMRGQMSVSEIQAVVGELGKFRKK